MLIVVVDTHQAAGEGQYFAVCDEHGLVDLTLRVDIDAAEEE